MKIIITGAYAIGTHLARLLSRNQEEITIIDDDQERLDRIGADYDLLTLCGSASSVRTLREAGTENADLFIAVSPDENANINSCILAHALHARKTVAKVNDAEYVEDDVRQFYKDLGVDQLIYPEILAAKEIINGLKMSWVRQRWDVHGGALVMLAIKLRDNCQILNQPLKDLCGPDDPYHVVAIKRHQETIIPGGNDELRCLDLVYFMTMKQYIPYIRQITGKESYTDVHNVMFMGGGMTAVRTLQSLPEYMNAKIIEINPDRCEELNELIEDKTLVIEGDARDTNLLEDEGIKNTQAFVALTGNAETNILACLTAKRLGVRKTVADVENLDYASMAEELDIGTIINKKAIAASRIYQLMLDADVLNVTFLMSANADVAEFVAKDDSKVIKLPVKDLRLPQDVTIGGLVRNDKGMLVNGNTQIEAGDHVVVFCHGVNMKALEKYFNSPRKIEKIGRELLSRLSL
ncbi:Trk system potassium transport protein TrkA [Hallella multisaccharivorax DSM 17128]|uniref:Trk system potassium uptake protein TrkA n=1 Tax=Hallella multisaccharivorax DSM 17128 TaxID=688246 RepID=F8N7U6_9BACT|nr:Trk system potassium transporter TrkA [Hallella multisaccharivorax]EGN56451.1 TrkA-N domain protein [Hallella multisaccharivorax DSM 17128]GJG29981.1 Trk system potassium transport protein TrkA [Hallella multisaccharivorax DSM 17128]